MDMHDDLNILKTAIYRATDLFITTSDNDLLTSHVPENHLPSVDRLGDIRNPRNQNHTGSPQTSQLSKRGQSPPQKYDVLLWSSSPFRSQSVGIVVART